MNIEQNIITYIKENTGNYFLRGIELLAKSVVIYTKYYNLKDTYLEISKRHNLTVTQIERAIRYFIQQSDYFIDNLDKVTNLNATFFLFHIFYKDINREYMKGKQVHASI